MRTRFAADPATLTATSIIALVQNRVGESEDLDFKRTSYYHENRQAREKGQRDLACDVTALANNRGGVIVLGVEEKNEVAHEARPVQLAAAHLRWMREAIATQTQPHVDVDLITVPSDDDPTKGWILVVVPQGSSRPYSITVGDYLRFPRRHGTTTRNLREAEIADLYRTRFAVTRDAVDRSLMLMNDTSRGALRDGATTLWLTLAPLLAAPVGPLDAAYGRTMANRLAGPYGRPELWTGFFWDEPIPSFGHRRVMLIDVHQGSPIRKPYAELHADGSGFASIPLPDIGRGVSPRRPYLTVDTAQLTWAVARSLSALAQHARDGVGAGGEGTVRARLLADSPFRIGYMHPRGFPEDLARSRVADHPAETDLIVSIDAALANDTGLLRATSLLTHDLLQSLGVAEDRLLTREGEIRGPSLPAASRGDNVDPATFAAQRGVTVLA